MKNGKNVSLILCIWTGACGKHILIFFQVPPKGDSVISMCETNFYLLILRNEHITYYLRLELEMDLGQRQVFILRVPPFSTHIALFCSIQSCDYGMTKLIPEGMFKILVIKF